MIYEINDITKTADPIAKIVKFWEPCETHKQSLYPAMRTSNSPLIGEHLNSKTKNKEFSLVLKEMQM